MGDGVLHYPSRPYPIPHPMQKNTRAFVQLNVESGDVQLQPAMHIRSRWRLLGYFGVRCIELDKSQLKEVQKRHGIRMTTDRKTASAFYPHLTLWHFLEPSSVNILGCGFSCPVTGEWTIYYDGGSGSRSQHFRSKCSLHFAFLSSPAKSANVLIIEFFRPYFPIGSSLFPNLLFHKSDQLRFRGLCIDLCERPSTQSAHASKLHPSPKWLLLCSSAWSSSELHVKGPADPVCSIQVRQADNRNMSVLHVISTVGAVHCGESC
jgi:hypothetical protein